MHAFFFKLWKKLLKVYKEHKNPPSATPCFNPEGVTACHSAEMILLHVSSAGKAAGKAAKPYWVCLHPAARTPTHGALSY